MRRTIIPAALAAAFLLGDWPGALQHPTAPATLIAPAAAQGYDDSAYQDFYDSMAPYGRWVVSARWGHVWYPNDVPRGWRPYTDGHWAYTDQYGWTWVSDQAWGWAAFHYGRWAFDPGYGWVWVPGRVWGPAWVSFRASDEYIGWAPLPPEASGYDYDNYEPPVQPGWWSFVRRDRFDSRQIAPQLVVSQQNVNIIHVTKNITNIKVVNNYGVNRSFDDRSIERYTRRPVEHYHPAVVDEDAWRKGQRPSRNQVVVVRPPKESRQAGQGSGNKDGNLQDQQRRQQQEQAGQQQDRRRQQEKLQQEQLQQQQAGQQQDRRRQQEKLQQQQLQQQQAGQQQDRRRQQEKLQQEQLQQQQAGQQQDRRRQQEKLQQEQLQQQQAGQQQDRRRQQEKLQQQQLQQQQAGQRQDRRRQQEQLQQQQQFQQRQAHQQQDQQRQRNLQQQQEGQQQARRQQNGNGNGHGNQENGPPPKHGSCGQPGQGPC